MFFQILLATLLGLASPSNYTTSDNGSDPGTTLNDGGGPGGDTGHIPPPPPPKP